MALETFSSSSRGDAPEGDRQAAAAAAAWLETAVPDAGTPDGGTPEKLLEWALGRFQQRIALFTAFQAEGMVLLDMAWRIDPGVRVVTIDTGRLPEETFRLIEQVRERYAIAVEVVAPDAGEVAELVAGGGPNLFYRSVSERRACCRVRKVAPLRRALSGLSAWVTGQRRDQAPSRAGIGRAEIDAEHGGIVKLNPLADWTWDEVWTYLRVHEVPYHAYYDQGYTSIGCAPCTRAVRPWEDHRAGRWWWEEPGSHKECGLHFTAPSKNGRRPLPQTAGAPVSA
jgi:thioredoxin-dependent adenylylsulfate APS reductase